MATGYDGSIRIDTRVDTKGFNTGVKSVESGLGKITSSLGKMAAAVGVAFSVTALVKFGKQAVDIASDLAEVENVVTTAFGSMSDQVDQWAKSSIKNFGMSELSAKRTASTYMAMNAGMGLTGQAAADMAMRVAERTADIASFYNMTQEEADTMLKSIWTGETESLKQIGVVMTQTNLDAYALANGINKTTSEMTQAEQVQLRYAYVMDQTRLAAGDFAKTQDSWANQTRILSEQWKQFLGILGDGIIQVLTPFIRTLNKIVEKLIEWAQAFRAIVSALFGGGKNDASDSLIDSSDQAADSQEDLADAAQKANEALKKQATSIDELNILNQGIDENEDISSAFPDFSLPDGETVVVGENWEISPTVQNIIDTLTRLKDIFTGLVKSFLESPFAQWFSETLADAFDFAKERGAVFFDWLGDQKPILKSIAGRLKRMTDRLWDFMEPIADTAWETFKDVIERIQEAFQNIWSVLFRLTDKFWELIEVIWDLLEQAGIIEFWQTQLQNIIEFLGDIFGDLITWIEDHFLALEKVLGGFLDFLIGVFTGDWERAWGGLQSIVEGWRDSNMADVNLVKGLWESLRTFVSNTWENIKNTVSNLASQIWRTINELPSKIGYALGVAFAKVQKWGVDLLNWAKETIPRVIDNIVYFFKTLPQRIHDLFVSFMDWLNRLPSTLYHLGKNLVQGLWNGIVSVKDWFVSKINDFLGGFGAGYASEMGLGEASAIPIEPAKVPALATGAVIPPNQQFMAVLGDQKHGRNLEAPESLLRQIVREEGGGNSEIIYLLQQLVDMTRDRDPSVTLEVDGRKLAEAVERGQKARGVPIFG